MCGNRHCLFGLKKWSEFRLMPWDYIWWLCRSINADSLERLSRLWILLQFTDMTLSLFAICLRFDVLCHGAELSQIVRNITSVSGPFSIQCQNT